MSWFHVLEKMRKDLGRKPTLKELIEAARSYEMTAEEREEQRRSWVVGEYMLENPHLTRFEALERYYRARREVDGK